MNTGEILNGNDLDAIRKACIKDRLPSKYSDEEKDDDFMPSIRFSQYYGLLDKISLDAKNYAVKNGLTASAYEELLDNAFPVAYLLKSGRFEYEDSDLTGEQERERYNFWRHNPQLLNAVKIKKPPHFDRGEIEGAAKIYLDLPFRSSELDKLLVDMLMALEFSAFADQMLNPNPYGTTSPLKQLHPFWMFLIGLVANAVLFIGLGSAALYLGWEWVGGILIGIFFLLTAISIFALPFAVWRFYKARKQIAELLLSMSTAYQCLNSGGPISVRHLQEMINVSINKGAVWPAPLFALLDDIQARDGRF